MGPGPRGPGPRAPSPGPRPAPSPRPRARSPAGVGRGGHARKKAPGCKRGMALVGPGFARALRVQFKDLRWPAKPSHAPPVPHHASPCPAMPRHAPPCPREGSARLGMAWLGLARLGWAWQSRWKIWPGREGALKPAAHQSKPAVHASRQRFSAAAIVISATPPCFNGCMLKSQSRSLGPTSIPWPGPQGPGPGPGAPGLEAGGRGRGLGPGNGPGARARPGGPGAQAQGTGPKARGLTQPNGARACHAQLSHLPSHCNLSQVPKCLPKCTTSGSIPNVCFTSASRTAAAATDLWRPCRHTNAMVSFRHMAR